MAIYQFYLAPVPELGLLKKHEILPTKINIRVENGYFKSNTEAYWKLAKIDSIEIIQEIDQLVNREDWGKNNAHFSWKTYTNQLDNDAWMATNGSSGEIEEFSFRADLREPHLTFLRAMITLSHKFNWLLMDQKGNLAKPNLGEIGKLIQTSKPTTFHQNAAQFLADLNDGRIKPG